MQSSSYGRTTDKQYIKSVLTHPTIWPHISEGVDVDPEEYDPPIDNETHFLKVEGGLFILHPYKDGWKFHANMIERNGKGDKEAVHAFNYLKKIGAKKVYAVIPISKPNVTAYAKRIGFKEYMRTITDAHFMKELF